MSRADKNLLARRFSRAAASYDRQAAIQRRVAETLLALLPDRSSFCPQSILEIGCCTGLFTRRLLLRYPSLDVLHVNDLADAFAGMVLAGASAIPDDFRFLAGDIESIPLPRRYELIASSSTFHWLHDLPRLLAGLRHALAPGGLLLFSLYGPENLREIRSLTGIGLNYYSMEEISSLLGQHFQVLAAREAIEHLAFPSPLEVLRHLRETGVNALTRETWSRKRLRRFSDAYLARHGVDQGVSLSYHPMYFLALKP